MKLPNSPLSCEYHQNHSILDHRGGCSYVCSEKQCLWSIPAAPQRTRLWGYLTFTRKCSKVSPLGSLVTAFHHSSSQRFQVCLSQSKRQSLTRVCLLMQIIPLPKKHCINQFLTSCQYSLCGIYVEAKKSNCDSTVIQLLMEKLETTWKIRMEVWLREYNAEIHCRYLITTQQVRAVLAWYCYHYISISFCSHSLLSLGHTFKKKSGIGMYLSNYNLVSFLVPEGEALGNQTCSSPWNSISSVFHSCSFLVHLA